jgi:hypothetical protein
MTKKVRRGKSFAHVVLRNFRTFQYKGRMPNRIDWSMAYPPGMVFLPLKSTSSVLGSMDFRHD